MGCVVVIEVVYGRILEFVVTACCFNSVLLHFA